MQPASKSGHERPRSSDVLVAVAQQLDQPRKIAEQMDCNIALYVNPKGHYFLHYDAATVSLALGGRVDEDAESVWPIASEKDWESFVTEDIDLYRWLIYDEDSFAPVRDRARSVGVCVKELEDADSFETYDYLRSLKEKQNGVTKQDVIVIPSETDEGNVTRLKPKAAIPNEGDTVLQLPMLQSFKREMAQEAERAGMSVETYATRLLERGLRGLGPLPEPH